MIQIDKNKHSWQIDSQKIAAIALKICSLKIMVKETDQVFFNAELLYFKNV